VSDPAKDQHCQLTSFEVSKLLRGPQAKPDQVLLAETSQMTIETNPQMA